MSYPSYAQETSLAEKWLGSMPAQWQVRRLKYCVNLINQKLDTLPKGYKYFGLENIESQTGRVFPPNEDVIPEGMCNHFNKGDVLFGKLRPYLAKAMLAEESGGCTTELLVLRPRLVNAKFLLYYLLADGFIKIVDSSTYGAKMPRASWDFIGNLPVLIPSPDVQHAIVAFLDFKTTQIDELITEKERQIELLDIKRQAVITHAVINEINPVEFSNSSGAEWLGTISRHLVAGDRTIRWLNLLPKSWGIQPLKYLVGINQKALGEDTEPSTRIHYIDIGSVDSNGEIRKTEKLDFGVAPSRARRIVSSGDTLISTVRTYLKAIAYCHHVDNNLICSTGFAVLSPKSKIYPKFLFYWVRSSYFINEIVSRSTGVSYPAINAAEIGNLPFPLIDLDLQRDIATNLDKETAQINEMIQAVQTQIDLLRNYRSTLITDAVTGKINVQGVTL